MTQQNEEYIQETANRDAVFSPKFRDDLVYWIESDRKTALRAFKLIEAILHDVWGDTQQIPNDIAA